MRAEWLIRSGSSRVIAVFGGWGIGSDPFTKLPCTCDMLFLDDYRELDWGGDTLKAYDTVDVIAWSFGVAAFAHWMVEHNFPVTRKVAVNGTLTPVDRRTGIPPVVFQRTQKTLSQQSFVQFAERVFNQPIAIGPIDVVALGAELDAVEQRGSAPTTQFDRIWISEADKIFPPANQNRAWADQSVNTCLLPDAAHAPFGGFSSIEAMLA